MDVFHRFSIPILDITGGAPELNPSFRWLSAYNYLPSYFAWPAGVGDMFIGVTAPSIYFCRFTIRW